MTQNPAKIDAIDAAILQALQANGSLSQRALAERVGLSQNACHRRLQRLTEAGVLKCVTVRIGAAALALDVTGFVMIRTRHHDAAWMKRLTQRVESIPDIVEIHRVGGDWDYILKVVTTGMAGYDRVYRALVADLGFESVTGIFSMESVFEGRPLKAP